MAQVPRADAGLICPLHKKDVSKVCHTCPWWVQLKGASPNTGEMIDDWRCSVAYLPILMVEVAQKANQAGAATEDMRNEITRRMDLQTRRLLG